MTAELGALVDASGQVANLILYDPEHAIAPPAGLILVSAAGVDPAPRIGWTHGPGGFVAPVAAPPPAPTLADRRAALAQERYDRQISGVLFQAGGASAPSLVASDPPSTVMLNGSYAAARDGFWVDGTPWKMIDGSFVALTAADMKTLALKVMGYIAACFAHEAQLGAALAADLTADITLGWPPNT